LCRIALVGNTDVLALAASSSFAGCWLLLLDSFSVDFYILSSVYIGELFCKTTCETSHKTHQSSQGLYFSKATSGSATQIGLVLFVLHCHGWNLAVAA
jgi:hypothetical protein